MEMRQDFGVECAIHTEQIEQIDRMLGAIHEDTREIRADIRTVLPAIAAHAEAIGDLKRRATLVESHLNWGKWFAGIATVVLAVAAYLAERVP